MAEIRSVDRVPISISLKVDSEGPKVTTQGTWDPSVAIEQLYASKSGLRYKNQMCNFEDVDCNFVDSGVREELLSRIFE